MIDRCSVIGELKQNDGCSKRFSWEVNADMNCSKALADLGERRNRRCSCGALPMSRSLVQNHLLNTSHAIFSHTKSVVARRISPTLTAARKPLLMVDCEGGYLTHLNSRRMDNDDKEDKRDVPLANCIHNVRAPNQAIVASNEEYLQRSISARRFPLTVVLNMVKTTDSFARLISAYHCGSENNSRIRSNGN